MNSIFFLSGVRYAALAAVLVFASPVLYAQAPNKPAAIADVKVSERDQLEAKIKAALQDRVNKQKRIDGQGQYVSVISVKIQPETNMVTVNLSDAYLPRNADYKNGQRRISSSFEESLHELDNGIYGMLQGKYDYAGAKFLIEGRDLYDYFTDDRARRDESFREASEKQKKKT